MTRAQHLDALENEVSILIRRVRRVIVERARRIDPSLPASSYSILQSLALIGERRASTVAEEFGLDKGAVSRQVAQMEELGLLSRRPDPTDGRAQLISLTDRGRASLADIDRERRTHFADKLAGWTDAELSDFVARLRRYNQTFSG